MDLRVAKACGGRPPSAIYLLILLEFSLVPYSFPGAHEAVIRARTAIMSSQKIYAFSTTIPPPLGCNILGVLCVFEICIWIFLWRCRVGKVYIGVIYIF